MQAHEAPLVVHTFLTYRGYSWKRSEMNAGAERFFNRCKRTLLFRYLRTLLSLGLLFALGAPVFAQPEPLTLTPPNSRFAAPGDFVTLVFRVKSAEALTVEVEARSSLGWQILRQPEDLTLTPGQSQPIALTLAAPNNASAFAENTVTLELRSATSKLSAQTDITVSERSSLSLDAPEAVVLGAEGFDVTLVNDGNVASLMRLELRQRNEVLLTRERELAPQERRTEKLEVEREGTYTLVLTGSGEEIRKTLSVTRFGAPPPQPFSLEADASVSLSTEGWQGELSVQGPLSDFTTLNARLGAQDIASSYAALTHKAWTAQLGGSSSDPYRLGLSAGVGASGRYKAPRWSVAGALGGLTDAFSGYAAGAYRGPKAFVALGLGVRADAAQFSVRSDVALGAFNVEAEASYDDVIDASLEAKRKLSKGTLKGRLELDQLLSDDAGLSARLDYNGPNEHLYASGALPLSESAKLAQEGWSIGLQDRLILDGVPLPGTLTLGLEIGNEQGFAQLQYETALASEWLASAQFGAVYDEFGLGLDTLARVSQSGADYYSFGGDFTYYPRSAHLDGQVDLKLQSTQAPFTFFGNGTWDLTKRQLGLNAGTVWYSGPWRVNLAGNANYSYLEDADDFSFGVSLSSDFSFDIAVSDRVSELAGGRRAGTVQGVVRSDTGPLAGIEVRVGRFRLLTDEAGRYRAEVAPGTYKVSLEVTSLPITYRLIGEDTLSTEVGLKEEVTQDFRLARTAALTGRVLEDADADGVADTPERGLAARLLLIDTEGLYRSLNTDKRGYFSARGLLPGEATLQLASYPVGSVLLGDVTRTFSVRAGNVTDITFLLQPARTRARSFGTSALRVRRVTPSVERVPPGSAPLVSVTVQGDAEAVSVSTPAGSANLSLVDGAWLGRVAVPLDTPPGVYTFEVTARRGDETASRRGQFVIDPEIAPLEATADGPINAGETLDLFATPLFAATEVSVESPLGNVALTEVAPGQYSAALPIAADTEDAVYNLLFRAVKEDGGVVEQTRRVRVLNTP